MKISDFIENNKIICVTHGGIMHADDLCSAALISALTPKKVEVNIIRIGRDIKVEDIPSNALVFDVLNGEFDHHDDDQTKTDGRKLASFGKLFRAFKEDILEIYNLDEEAWKNIDQNFVKYIDHTDNTGEMNPYNYMTNCISRVAIDPAGDETFKAIMSTIIIQLTAMFHFEAQGAKDRRILASLPKVVIKNKVFLYKSEPGYIQVPQNLEGVSGVIICMGEDSTQGIFMVKMTNGETLSKKGLRNEGDVVFTHPNGFMGKMNTFSAVCDCI